MGTLLSLSEFRRAVADDILALAPVNTVLRKQFIAEIKSEGDDGPIEIAISTAAIDRMGDTISLDGWDMANFRRNPIVLFAHQASQLPVARSTAEWISDGALRSRPVFTERGDYEFGWTVGQLVRKGFLNSASVGFAPLEWKPAEGRESKDPWGGPALDFLKQELLEYSIVPIPANPEALVAAKSAGIDLAPLVQWAERVLDETRGRGFWMARNTVEMAWDSAHTSRLYSYDGFKIKYPLPEPVEAVFGDPEQEMRAEVAAEPASVTEIRDIVDRAVHEALAA